MLIRWVNKWLKFDQFCQLCGARCGTEQSICLACEAELPWLDRACSCCALPLEDEDSSPLCPECQLKTPLFDQVQAPWRFDFPIDSLISRFKQRGDWPSGRIMAHYLARHLENAYHEGLSKPEALLPVPLSARRLRQRGFDQTRMLAEWLGKDLAIPVELSLIQRVRDTPAQKQLNAQERQQNLQDAFAIQSPTPYRHLAIVDDVMTTGATVNALAQLLRQAGVERVDVYALARTPKPVLKRASESGPQMPV